MTMQRLIRRGKRALGGGHKEAPSVTRASSPEELRRQLGELGTWMYRFDLGDGVFTALHDEYLDSIHSTRASMIFPEIERRFADR